MKFLGKNGACIMRIDDGFKKIVATMSCKAMGTWEVIATAFL